MRKILTFVVFILFTINAFAQNPYPATSAKERIESFQQRKALQEKSLVANIPFESVGPTVFSGRVVDLDVSPKDPSHFYVAYASGGLWKTTNNGTTFKPIFDNEIVMTIGDIAVNWETGAIWVGTGENNSSRSSYSGVGIYKSTDDGKTWEHKGLGESHHIGRIVLHPTNGNIAWVASLGHLYSPDKERGLYMTTDGGNTWEQTLFVNENAGGIDIVVDPQNSNNIYAATWHRERRAWNFVESGEGSGIYKSTDGGKTWNLLTTKEAGFPTGEGVGRIGLAISNQNGKEVLYALLDNYFRRPAEPKEEGEGLTKDDLRLMRKDDFLKLDKDVVAKYLDDNNFPKKYNAKKVISMVKKDKIRPNALVNYLEDANSLLFNTPVIAAEVYRSDDGGKTWKKTHDDYLNSTYNSYGYYFGNIRVSPHDADKIYIMGFRVLRSNDGGKTFKLIGADNVHVDHHALWVNPDRDEHIILGNDGGVNISYDDGEEWIKCNSPAVGQFYYAAVDMEKPYNIYGGLQDNGVWKGPHTYREGSKAWHNSGQYPYKSIMGGDGMQVAIDSRDNTVYTGFQYGFYFRINPDGSRKMITPKHDLGDRPYRWNWQSPIHLSIHNEDILYMGGNKLFRSMKKGDNMKAISNDLTKGGIKGDVPYGTLTAIHESPLKFGLIYTGSDDGLLHITRDGGNTWHDITKGLPENLWITRVQASQYEEGRLYVSMNGYRWDNYEAHAYVSEDFGDTWKRIGTDLPLEPINVIKEDPKNENIVYIGTDHGLYVSFDQGDNFMLMNKDLPAVAVHDIVIHPRDRDMIVATHGRSFYKANAAHLQEMDDIMDQSLFVFDLKKTRFDDRWGRQFSPWRDAFEPEMEIPFFTNLAGSVNVVIKNDDGAVISRFSHDAAKGINYTSYDLSVNGKEKMLLEKMLNKGKGKRDKKDKLKKTDTGKAYLLPGKYSVEMSQNGKTAKSSFEVFKRK